MTFRSTPFVSSSLVVFAVAFALAACGTDPISFGGTDITPVDGAGGEDATGFDVPDPDEDAPQVDVGPGEDVEPPDVAPDVIAPPDVAPDVIAPPDVTEDTVSPPDSEDDTMVPTELCDNRADDDGDGRIDCADEDCFEVYWRCDDVENCIDTYDNDGDGLIDCADDECAEECDGGATELCDNRADDDGDGRIDCADEDCFEVYWRCDEVENCTDTYDNDGNGRVDCDDAQCAATDACAEPPERETECGDLRDNDGDGRVDCGDRDCLTTSPMCSTRERCTDDFDNDGDGLLDCADDDCEAHVACIGPPRETNCINLVDDDDDDLVDCDDDDCREHPACRATGDPEICNNDVDDDGDDYVDCADPNCFDDAGCEEDGNCSDEDLATLEGVDYTSLIADCGLSCFSGTIARSCVRDCASERAGISLGCADCFGGVAECASTTCLTACLTSGGGDACTSCLADFCGDSFFFCSGLEL